MQTCEESNKYARGPESPVFVFVFNAGILATIGRMRLKLHLSNVALSFRPPLVAHHYGFEIVLGSITG